MSVVQSHTITIFFAGCVGFCFSCIISQRRNAAQRELLRHAAIVQQSEDAIISTDLDGIVVSWNRGAERIYGYSAAEALGRHISFCYPPEKRAKARAFLQRVANGEAIGRFDTQRLAKNGTMIDVSVSISAIKDATGKIVGASGIARDITAHRRAEKELHVLSAALEATANGIVITDRHGTIVWVNHAFTIMTGYSKEEVLGKNPRLLKSGDQPEAYYSGLWSAISSGKVWNGEIVNRRKDGTTYSEEMTITPVIRDRGSVVDTYFIAIKQDITERKQSEHTLRQAEEKYRTIFEDAVVGIFQSTPDGRLLGVNPEFARLYGYDSPDDLMVDWSADAHRSYADPHEREHFRRALEEKGSIYDFEFQACRKDGSKIWLRENTRVIHDSSGVALRYEGTVTDITGRKAAEERVQYLAYYDALTGLPNRTLLADRLSKALASANRQKDKVALLFLDLDRFKSINDSLGHSVGDLVLQEVAERLKKQTREQDTVARLGGDEFLIVLNNVKEISDVAVAAKRFMDAMNAELVVQGHSFGITCSLGISIFPEHGMDRETLVKNADAAMYNAKENGRNNFQFFTAEMTAQVAERLTLESSLRTALDKKQLFLVYQPQMDITSGKIIGVEALLRWQHPELGLVPPDKFIRIAENSGLILPIGEWVLRTACSQARKWQDEGLSAVRVAVNVSAVQFRQPDFCAIIGKVLHETGLAPQYLELELTESLLLNSADVMHSVIQELRDIGVTLAIDDFGTGYSSFGYLRQFRVSKLKIDRSFIRDVAVNPDDAAIANAIISMARSLSLKVIAEGVENEAQMSFLREHLCDEIQGYYFSKPLAADKVADKLRGDCPEPFVRAQASGGLSSQGTL
jgi:diguanylate cyclase (GGDEF)-like protein/PAS domain S-box-containing protein